MCRYQTTMSVFMPHINSMQSNYATANTGIHSHTLLVYIPEQICLQHCTYTSHCSSTVVYIQTPHYFKGKVEKTIHSNFYLACYIHIYIPVINMPLRCHIYAIFPNYFMHINGVNMTIYMPHMNSPASNM